MHLNHVIIIHDLHGIDVPDGRLYVYLFLWNTRAIFGAGPHSGPPTATTADEPGVHDASSSQAPAEGIELSHVKQRNTE